MEVIIKILVENTVFQSDLLAEHGFSSSVELENRIILFDTGQSDLLVLIMH